MNLRFDLNFSEMNDDNAAPRLISAIGKNEIATASSLISSGGVNLNDEPWPLHFAAQLGRLEIMTLLLDAGADIDLAEEDGLSACHYAIDCNQFDALKLLVERGANLNANNKSLLAYAAQHCRSDQILIYLLDVAASLDNLKRSELMSLVRSVAVFRRLLARGVNFDAMRDESGCTLCHHVAHNVTDEKDFRFLVDVCGADSVNDVNDDRETPIHWAAHGSNVTAIRVLAELGANIDEQDNDGRTALHVSAAAFDPLSRLELLLALGADVRLVNIHGQAALKRALLFRNKSAIALLVAAGGGQVDLDQPNGNGESLRMIAERNDVDLPTADEIDAARRRIAKTRLDLVRRRAAEICIGLQQLDPNALQLCEIMMHSFGAIGALIAFHQWWAIATKVKHFVASQR